MGAPLFFIHRPTTQQDLARKRFQARSLFVLVRSFRDKHFSGYACDIFIFFSVFASTLSLFRTLSVIYSEARFQQTKTNHETNNRKQTTHPPR